MFLIRETHAKTLVNTVSHPIKKLDNIKEDDDIKDWELRLLDGASMLTAILESNWCS